eukprot:CAMPEP_0197694406 /NCGR_PEP_ID=MMETSP1338-20131121/113775_1 /TAXON_ID=43686 ORGANISM="Pelagodinium beii, Strain RCC1491" /NCGR_SAMPLE_ID=MMETSP1338 /ASSEMBLY_ACC=CAM_ASM_000754 /LENGTH=376 /DNA_ID=CAMNT_0043277239 /DNA_START=27 /DNA_END=1153 /DNA_ORIENTATION=+
MILYPEQNWRALFSLKGSVLQHAARWSVLYSILTFIGSIAFGYVPEWTAWVAERDVSAQLKDYSFILGFTIVFRSQVAYGRWWEGATLLQQLRGEWFNSYSGLLAFCNDKPEKREAVEHFQHRLAALVSLLYVCALKQVSAMHDNNIELLGLEGFSIEPLELLTECHDACEVVMNWIQRLIVDADTTDIIQIAPPILSRVYNQLGNGIVKLRNARKIRQFPIPYPLAQMVAFIMVVHTNVTALVVSLTVSSPVLASLMSFAVITAFWCIYYISLELEQPFGDAPNDLPLHDMAMDLNHSLIGMLTEMARRPPPYRWSSGDHPSIQKLDLRDYVATLREGRRPGLTSRLTSKTDKVVGKREETLIADAARQVEGRHG